jgi:hypothetical protein
MNICIGGPWHGSRVLAPRKHEKAFHVKDNSSEQITTYLKTKIKTRDEIYIFWVSKEIDNLEMTEQLKKYIYDDFVITD